MRPNKYEAAPAHITVINSENLDTVMLSLANTSLAVGQQFEIRGAELLRCTRSDWNLQRGRCCATLKLDGSESDTRSRFAG